MGSALHHGESYPWVRFWLFPPRLLEQLERLQRAVCRSAIPPAPFTAHAAAPALVPFSVEACLSAPLPSAQKEPDLAARLCALPGEQPRHNPSLNWQRRRKNPFASEWERILCWVRDHPTGCARDLFQEFQHLSPGRYHPSQMLFLRLQEPASLTGKHISPSLLRDTFAVRFLQAGGDLDALQNLLGLDDPVSVKHYQRFCDQVLEKQEVVLTQPQRSITPGKGSTDE